MCTAPAIQTGLESGATSLMLRIHLGINCELFWLMGTIMTSHEISLSVASCLTYVCGMSLACVVRFKAGRIQR